MPSDFAEFRPLCLIITMSKGVLGRGQEAHVYSWDACMRYNLYGMLCGLQNAHSGVGARQNSRPAYLYGFLE